MPFMFGPAPIRRTAQYLGAGKLVFKERVKIMLIHYNMYFKNWRLTGPTETTENHRGTRDFYFWDVPQIQYRNPKVQILQMLEKTPTPFIKCYLDDEKEVTFDTDMKSRQEILAQLIKILGKSDQQLKMEKKKEEKNPALFGYNNDRFCLCEIPGQVPCPGLCPLPKKMTGKYQFFKTDELEQWENDLNAEYPSHEDKMFITRAFPVIGTPPNNYVEGIEHIRVPNPRTREGSNLPKVYLPPDKRQWWLPIEEELGLNKKK